MLKLNVSGETKYLAKMQIQMPVTGSAKIKARGGQTVFIVANNE